MPKSSPVHGREKSIEAERAQRDRGLNGAAVESVAPKTRRRFSPAEKLRLVQAGEAAVASGERGALEAFLRQEGIYSSHLSVWRQQLGARGPTGRAAKKPCRRYWIVRSTFPFSLPRYGAHGFGAKW